MTDIALLNKVNEIHLAKLEKYKKTFSFPQEIKTEYQQNTYITEHILRKYHTLTDGLYKKDGTTNAKAERAGRLLTSRRIRARAVDQPLISKKVVHVDIGKMFTFLYNPKHKETLPYYDRMPVCVPISVHRKGFTALNFHHMSPVLRLHVLEELESFKMAKDLRTRFRIKYSIIQASNKFKLARPMIRSYLYSQMLSPIIQIPESDWALMQVLPAPKMIGQHELLVWQENKRNALRG